jgi:Tfp pilus assembly protein PilE
MISDLAFPPQDSPPRDPSEDGVTMIEIAVSMTVMTVVMAMFTAGVLQVYRTVVKTESLSIAQTQIVTAFQRLDHELRYASAISRLASTSHHYVEYLMADGGTGKCVQLRLSTTTRQLSRRQWPKGAMPSTGSWGLLVSSVEAGSAKPFDFVPASGTFNYQRLQVHLKVTVGAGAGGSVRESRATFTALNTSVEKTDPAVCTEGRSVP